MPDLSLQRLRLFNFRNYEHVEVEFSPRLNGIVGNNGMGKTNLLEAIYYLCMCRSSFSTQDRDLRREGSEAMRVEGHFLRREHLEKIAIKVPQRRPKSVERNGAAYERLSQHIGLLPVVMSDPADHRLALDGSEERRRFLDNTLSQMSPDYLEALIRYNKLIAQRNAALKQMAGQPDKALLAVYDAQLPAPAERIVAERQAFVARFAPVFEATYARIAQAEEQATCHYESQLLAQDMASLLRERLQKDLLLERSTGGPHRDELCFFIKGRPLKRFASQGQLKSFILAMRLAQYSLLREAKGLSPILLLDDLFDKLDEQRVQQLLGLLAQPEFGQVFISDTHPERIARIIKQLEVPHRLFHIVEGQIADISAPA